MPAELLCCHRDMTEAECKKADGSAAPVSDVAANGNIHMCVQKMGCYGGPACVAAGRAHGCYDCTSPSSIDCEIVNIAPGNEGMCVGGGADEGDHGDHGDHGHARRPRHGRGRGS